MNTLSDNSTLQFLTFRLGDETFGVEISKVREVLEYTTVTKVPRVPEFMRGVINVRGSVVPVLDLRLKFGMSKTEKTVNTCVIIVEFELNDQMIHLGAMADSVQEVLDLTMDQIEPPPKFGTRLDTEFLEGMGKVNEEFIMLLDINKVFSKEDISMMGEVDNAALAESAPEENQASVVE